MPWCWVNTTVCTPVASPDVKVSVPWFVIHNCSKRRVPCLPEVALSNDSAAFLDDTRYHGRWRGILCAADHHGPLRESI